MNAPVMRLEALTPEVNLARTPAMIARAAMLEMAKRKLPPTPENYAEAWVLAGGPPSAVNEAERSMHRLHRSERLGRELTELLRTLCTTLGVLAEDESWVHGQIESLEKMLEGQIDHASVAQLRVLLTQTTDMQRRITEQRRRVMAQFRSSLAELAQLVGDLVSSTGEFGDRIENYAHEISGASSITLLSSTVQKLLDDARGMQDHVAVSRDGLEKSRSATSALEREVSRLEHELSAASNSMATDHLTQTLNRRGLEDTFEQEIRQMRLRRTPFALALIDVDDFKKLNDAMGHLAGDQALVHLTSLLRDRLRPTDAVARFGGEEFVILLPGANLSNAQDTMVRLQRELTAHVFMHEQSRCFITFSGGVTAVGPQDTLTSAVGRADEAMYRAKRDGKNCVRVG